MISSPSIATVRTDIANGAMFTSTIDGGTGTLGSLNLVNDTVEVRYTLKGDTNLDGAVNVGDLGALATNYNTSGSATWAMGDSNYDDNVDVADLGALATNYGSSLPAGRRRRRAWRWSRRRLPPTAPCRNRVGWH